MRKFLIVAGLVLVGAVVGRSAESGEFTVREIKAYNSRILEIEGHGKKCYLHKSGGGGNVGAEVLLWCESK